MTIKQSCTRAEFCGPARSQLYIFKHVVLHIRTSMDENACNAKILKSTPLIFLFLPNKRRKKKSVVIQEELRCGPFDLCVRGPRPSPQNSAYYTRLQLWFHAYGIRKTDHNFLVFFALKLMCTWFERKHPINFVAWMSFVWSEIVIKETVLWMSVPLCERIKLSRQSQLRRKTKWLTKLLWL